MILTNPCLTCERPNRQPHQNNRLIFLTVGFLHLAWGIGLLFWPIQSVTAIANAVGSLRVVPAAILMIVVGLAAMSSTVVKHRYWALTLLVAQQIILIFSAWAAIECASNGQYADKTPASGSHILFDQLVYCLIAVMHTGAILQTHGKELVEWLFTS